MRLQCDVWALHADHITIKKGDAQEVEQTRQLIDAQIDAGYTSFAIDASHLFNFEGKTPREELEREYQDHLGPGTVYQEQDERQGFRSRSGSRRDREERQPGADPDETVGSS